MKIYKTYMIFILFFTNICFAISITDRDKIERENYHNTVKRGG